MPRRYPPQTRLQVIELARSGTRVAQLDQIQAKVNANAKALDVLTRKVRGISDTVGVGNINDSRNLYQMVVATYECVVNGCPSP